MYCARKIRNSSASDRPEGKRTPNCSRTSSGIPELCNSTDVTSEANNTHLQGKVARTARATIRMVSCSNCGFLSWASAVHTFSYSSPCNVEKAP